MTISGYYPSGDRSLYAEMHGAGAPTVVIESGSTMAGTSDPGWLPFISALEQETTVFLYDRGGLGQSGQAERPRPLSAFTADLHAVIQAAQPALPLVLVGCSLGGMIVTHYASLYPQDVRGVVLLDPPHPEIHLRTLALLPPVQTGEPPALTAFRQAAWLEQYDPLAVEESEGLDYQASLGEACAAWGLGDIPLVVMTAGRNEYDEGFPPDVAAAYEDAWMDCQRKYAALSNCAEHILVSDSEHVIHDQRPDLVLGAIRQLLRLGQGR